jgi:S-adenosylmethionine:tRNA ribosyltransferase-isomerase
MKLYTNDFNYELPEDKIALYPTENREQSKLLVYNGESVQHKVFHNIVEILPNDTLLVFNNSKVVPARLKFKKETGAIIEVFVLGPETESADLNTFFNSKALVRCECTIGNKKRWTKGTTLIYTSSGKKLKASVVDEAKSIVEFSWDGEESWGEMINQFGTVPLPPYIKRETVDSDKERYQTIYSREPGAVAAPTAGLHFTSKILEAIKIKGIKTEYLTLHVGAGTFLPIKSNKITDHEMHHERVVFTRENIERLLNHTGRIIPVGTTSCRSLESLYWYGIKLVIDNNAKFYIDQNFPYQVQIKLPTRKEALNSVLDKMVKSDLGEIHGSTSLYIYPGYVFKMCDGLITNFHQPGSTLILLVAALVGAKWRELYKEALQNDYRFLSYGDSSLLMPAKDD